MKIYKTKHGIVIEKDHNYFLSEINDWDAYINNDQLYARLVSESSQLQADESLKKIIEQNVEAPIGKQELWACGVTYIRSRIGREEESKSSGGHEFYTRVYEAERPEI